MSDLPFIDGSFARPTSAKRGDSWVAAAFAGAGLRW